MVPHQRYSYDGMIPRHGDLGPYVGEEFQRQSGGQSRNWTYYGLTGSRTMLLPQIDSVDTGSMGTGFVWIDRSRCGRERIGREEEGDSSGRVEIGVYDVILRRTPDNEDLVMTTDSEVLCRVVSRWVGQGGKVS
jgi:hypothetical protein